MSTTDDTDDTDDAIAALRECEDALEFVAEGDFPASELAQDLLNGLAEVDD